MTGRMLCQSGAAVLLALAAGCTARPAPGPDAAANADATGPTDTQVVQATGVGGDVASFTVRRQGRLMQVQVYRVGGGVQRVLVTSRTGRGIDRADARQAYDAAFAAAQQFDCGGGQPMQIYPDSATFQEDDQRSALTQGGPAWLFQGRCG